MSRSYGAWSTVEDALLDAAADPEQVWKDTGDLLDRRIRHDNPHARLVVILSEDRRRIVIGVVDDRLAWRWPWEVPGVEPNGWLVTKYALIETS